MVQITRQTVRQAALGSALLLLPSAGMAQQFVPAAPTANFDWANEPQRNQRVQDRPKPDYDPLGIRGGSFFFFPSLSVEGGYDSNVFATDNNTDDDIFADVSPSLRVVSNFGRHALNFSLVNTNRFYATETDDNYQDIAGTATGRLDITRQDILNGYVGLARRHEDRSSPDDTTGDEPTIFYTGQAGTAYRHNFNRLFGVVGADAYRLDFDSSQDDPNNDRDRWTYRFSTRLGYELSPSFNVFGDGGYSLVRYDTRPDNDGFDRNSNGWDVGVGTQIDFTGVLWGEARLGYASRNIEDSDLDDPHGPTFSTTMNWNVTQLTTLELLIGGAILETTVSENGEFASANLQQQIQFDVTHELRRNIMLTGSLGYIRDNFEGISRDDNYYMAGVGASYLLNRNLSLDANFSFDKRDSSADDENFMRNVFRVGVTARL